LLVQHSARSVITLLLTVSQCRLGRPFLPSGGLIRGEAIELLVDRLQSAAHLAQLPPLLLHRLEVLLEDPLRRGLWNERVKVEGQPVRAEARWRVWGLAAGLGVG